MRLLKNLSENKGEGLPLDNFKSEESPILLSMLNNIILNPKILCISSFSK